MEEERVYKLENGIEKILMSTIVFNNKRFLLLSDDTGNEVEVGYEEEGKIKYIDKSYPEFQEIIKLLYKKLEEN